MRHGAVCWALALLLATAGAHAEPSAGDPPPVSVGLTTRGYRVVRSPRPGLWIAGGALFGAGYLGAILLTLAEGFGGISPVLLVPIAGPWIGLASDLGNPGACPLQHETVDCSAFLVDLDLALSGALQAVGAIVASLGFIRHDRRVPTTLLTPEFSFTRPRVQGSGADVGPGVTFGVRGVF